MPGAAGPAEHRRRTRKQLCHAHPRLARRDRPAGEAGELGCFRRSEPRIPRSPRTSEESRSDTLQSRPGSATVFKPATSVALGRPWAVGSAELLDLPDHLKRVSARDALVGTERCEVQNAGALLTTRSRSGKVWELPRILSPLNRGGVMVGACFLRTQQGV